MDNMDKIQYALMDINEGVEFVCQHKTSHIRPIILREPLLKPTTRRPWGYLCVERKNAGLFSPRIFLCRDTYIAGRSEECNIIVTAAIISKIHFRIHRVAIGNRHSVFISDASSNGTFVNGIRLKAGEKMILKNRDKISLAHRKNLVFTFRSFQQSKRVENSRYQMKN